MHNHLPKQSDYTFLLILFGGLLIGLGLSWTIYAAPGNSVKLLSTEFVPTIMPELTANQPRNTPQPVIEV